MALAQAALQRIGHCFVLLIAIMYEWNGILTLFTLFSSDMCVVKLVTPGDVLDDDDMARKRIKNNMEMMCS